MVTIRQITTYPNKKQQQLITSKKFKTCANLRLIGFGYIHSLIPLRLLNLETHPMPMLDHIRFPVTFTASHDVYYKQ